MSTCLNAKEETETNLLVKESEKYVEYSVTPIIPRENLLSYREYPNLISLGVGSVHIVNGHGYIIHYGAERLVVSVDGKIFQAGDDLEEKVGKLKYMCKIKIEKIRSNIKSLSRLRYGPRTSTCLKHFNISYY